MCVAGLCGCCCARAWCHVALRCRVAGPHDVGRQRLRVARLARRGPMDTARRGAECAHFEDAQGRSSQARRSAGVHGAAADGRTVGQGGDTRVPPARGGDECAAHHPHQPYEPDRPAEPSRQHRNGRRAWLELQHAQHPGASASPPTKRNTRWRAARAAYLDLRQRCGSRSAGRGEQYAARRQT